MWFTLTAVAVAAAVAYWLIVSSEGVYLGSRVVVTLYDWNADVYDDVKGVMPAEDAFHLSLPLTKRLAGIRRPLVLDVATGTARLPLALLRLLEFDGQVVGLDLSSRMLEVAQRRTASNRDRVGLVRQTATFLPFGPATFDAVTCLEAFEFLPKQRAALKEMVRVLRPGGVLLTTNRIGFDALLLPGRAYGRCKMEELLREAGVTHVETRRWQVHYDLIEGLKLANRNGPGRL
jgi:ubiquinone/menaquinone biosynthesis C-methylase UbiE